MNSVIHASLGNAYPPPSADSRIGRCLKCHKLFQTNKFHTCMQEHDVSKADKLEQLKVRIDDKLSRIANNKQNAWLGEDSVLDLLGYLILFRIATLEEAEVAEPFEEKLPTIPAEKPKPEQPFRRE